MITKIYTWWLGGKGRFFVKSKIDKHWYFSLPVIQKFLERHTQGRGSHPDPSLFWNKRYLFQINKSEMVGTCIILTLAWRLEPGLCHWQGWRMPGLGGAGVDDEWSWSALPQWHGQESRTWSCPELEAVSLLQTSQWCRAPWRDAQLWSALHPSLSMLKMG